MAAVESVKSVIVLIVKGGSYFIQSILFHNAALFHYDEGMQEWMERYKFQGDYRLRTCFNEEINFYFQQHSADYIIPVPLSEKRMQERGFNQVIGLLEAADVPYTPFLIRKRGKYSAI